MTWFSHFLPAFATAAALAGPAWSDPTSLVSIPSTDVQAPGTGSLTLDTCFPLGRTDRGSSADRGLTVGLPGRIELGLDWFTGTRDPILGNLKWQVRAERRKAPAIAIGAYTLGSRRDHASRGAPSVGNLLYVIASRIFRKAGRIHVGYQRGQRSRVGHDSDMLLLGWDRQVTPKWWVGIDYASGKSAYGALSPGFSYTINRRASVAIGYDFYNDSRVNDTLQFDVTWNFGR
jgi:hypothetical protein